MIRMCEIPARPCVTRNMFLNFQQIITSLWTIYNVLFKMQTFRPVSLQSINKSGIATVFEKNLKNANNKLRYVNTYSQFLDYRRENTTNYFLILPGHGTTRIFRVGGKRGCHALNNDNFTGEKTLVWTEVRGPFWSNHCLSVYPATPLRNVFLVVIVVLCIY